MSVYVGTSGWNYPTGRGTWNGVFYPAGRSRGFDELAYYAEHFDTVEVNSTFYRVPEPGLTQGWLRRTPSSFVFSVKLYQKFTHPDMYLGREGVTDWDLSRADIDQFRHGIEPIASAGRLAAVLVQFPPSFHAEDGTREYLDWLLAAFDDYALAVELRHRSWSDAADDTRARLAAHGAAWTLIDEPKFESSVRQSLGLGPEARGPAAPTGARDGGLTYIRLHGRNAEKWWEHDASEDRYDYLYSPEELEPFAEAAKRAATTSRRVLVYLNNHFSAKAVANAAILRHELGQPTPGEYRQEMVERYPALAGIVTTPGLKFE
ncbi:MAG TPA: DUF72 domain-containing protein [Vicinamibacterales bacterium]|nr:DUF72 domain-containing protein [Vicinamibacterales bacterium]